MQKNSIRPIPSKQIIYEENYSIDQMSFNSHKSPIPNKIWESKICNMLNSPIIQSNSNSMNSNGIPNINIAKILSNNLLKANALSTYDKYIVSLCVEKKKSHVYTLYQEMQVCWSEVKTLKRLYSIEEERKRIQHYSLYYKHYLKYWAKPTLTSVYTNNLIHEAGKQKAQVYYDSIYGNKKKNVSKMMPLNTEANEEIIFDSYIKETIDNYSTTMTCESHEQLIYQRINELNPIALQENFSQSEIRGNGNKNSDGENNESIINIVKDWRKRRDRSQSNSHSEGKTRGKIDDNIYNKLANKHKKKASLVLHKITNSNVNTTSTEVKSKKISFIKISTNNTCNTKYAQNMNKTKIKSMKFQSMRLNVNRTSINNSKLTSGNAAKAKNLKNL